MSLTVRRFPCLADNYGFLVRDEATGQVAAIDTPDADRILAELKDSGWGQLDLILNTHWHGDHTAGNAALIAATGCQVWAPDEVQRMGPVDRVVAEGDRLELGQTGFRVMATPGHTLGHVVFIGENEPVAFVGDTLFVLGCGRLFEGTPDQMFDSLTRLSALPDETVVWCAHEYTEANARFALSVDDRPELRTHAETIFERRGRAEPTVPTTIGLEKQFNPFMRATGAADFARLRAAKDVF
jgi:hydroxyacylglutathione hydrolase